MVKPREIEKENAISFLNHNKENIILDNIKRTPKEKLETGFVNLKET